MWSRGESQGSRMTLGVLSQVTRIPIYYLSFMIQKSGRRVAQLSLMLRVSQGWNQRVLAFSSCWQIMFLVVGRTEVPVFLVHGFLHLQAKNSTFYPLPVLNSSFSLMLPARVGFLLLRAPVITLVPLDHSPSLKAIWSVTLTMSAKPLLPCRLPYLTE